jgi:S-formylglutathione hydrolase
MSIRLLSENHCFGGQHQIYEHQSNVLNCVMTFAVFVPPKKSPAQKFPVLYWLSGLTCNHENFMQKAGALKHAAELGIVIVAPDTSPRGENVPDDRDGSWDMGKGAGFYLDASETPWNEHYKMYSYVVKELPEIIEAAFDVSDMRSISGHSMGGHGALTIGLRNPQKYQSVSAFSPITNPVNVPWGKKAFSNYLGDDIRTWEKYDATVLMLNSDQCIPMLVDQGESDGFLEEQLTPEALENAASLKGFPLILNRREGYDHSYFFIQSFIETHIKFHGEHLKT